MNNRFCCVGAILGDRLRGRFVWSVFAIGVLSGCNLSDTGHASYLEARDFYASLTLAPRAINLAMQPPYDTVTLNVIREMGDGSPVPGAVTYSVSNPAITVSPNGVVTALSPIARAIVRVSATYDGVTRTDSAIVSVIAGHPDLLRDFGMRLSATDSAKIAVSGGGASYKQIPLIRDGQSGTNLSAVLVNMRVSDTTKARFVQSGNAVRLTPLRPGRLILYVSSFAYGRAWEDSLDFTVGWPLLAYLRSFTRVPPGQLNPIIDFYPNNLTLGVGACVVFWNLVEQLDMDVSFRDSASVEFPYNHISGCANNFGQRDGIGGNIAPFRQLVTGNILVDYFSRYKVRMFPSAGLYAYRSILHGTFGSIRVCDEARDTTCAPVRGEWY